MILPEVAEDNEGDVVVGWWFSTDRILDLRISPVGVVYYAGRSDEERFHGQFALPPEIGNFLSKHCRSEDSNER